MATGKQYWFSVFNRNGYRAREGGESFKTDAEPGDVFELTVLLSAPDCDEQNQKRQPRP